MLFKLDKRIYLANSWSIKCKPKPLQELTVLPSLLMYCVALLNLVCKSANSLLASTCSPK